MLPSDLLDISSIGREPPRGIIRIAKNGAVIYGEDLVPVKTIGGSQLDLTHSQLERRLRFTENYLAENAFGGFGYHPENLQRTIKDYFNISEENAARIMSITMLGLAIGVGLGCGSGGGGGGGGGGTPDDITPPEVTDFKAYLSSGGQEIQPLIYSDIDVRGAATDNVGVVKEWVDFDKRADSNFDGTYNNDDNLTGLIGTLIGGYRSLSGYDTILGGKFAITGWAKDAAGNSTGLEAFLIVRPHEQFNEVNDDKTQLAAYNSIIGPQDGISYADWNDCVLKLLTDTAKNETALPLDSSAEEGKTVYFAKDAGGITSLIYEIGVKDENKIPGFGNNIYFGNSPNGGFTEGTGSEIEQIIIQEASEANAEYVADKLVPEGGAVSHGQQVDLLGWGAVKFDSVTTYRIDPSDPNSQEITMCLAYEKDTLLPSDQRTAVENFNAEFRDAGVYLPITARIINPTTMLEFGKIIGQELQYHKDNLLQKVSPNSQ